MEGEVVCMRELLSASPQVLQGEGEACEVEAAPGPGSRTLKWSVSGLLLQQ